MTQPKDDIQLLKEVPLFSQMDDSELSSLRAIMEVENYQPNQVILSEGAAGDEFYVVVKGTVQVQVLDAGGQQVVVEEVAAGLLRNTPAPHSGMPTVGHRLGAAGWRETNLV